MLEKALAATGVGWAGFFASLALATTVLQFLTAFFALISTVFGFYLLIRKWRTDRKP